MAGLLCKNRALFPQSTSVMSLAWSGSGSAIPLYTASFCQTLAEVEAPTGEIKSIIGLALAHWGCGALRVSVTGPSSWSCVSGVAGWACPAPVLHLRDNNLPP